MAESAALPCCVARPALSEPRGVLAEAGVQDRGVRASILWGKAISRSPRGVRSPSLRSVRFCSVWPGEHFWSLAESARSPESQTAQCALLFCVARAALSEPRGVLAESGVLVRGVRAFVLYGQYKVLQ